MSSRGPRAFKTFCLDFAPGVGDSDGHNPPPRIRGSPMRPSSLVRVCLLLVPALVLAGSHLPAQEPPGKKADERPPDLVPPTAKELADKRMAFMKAACSHFTIQVGDRKEA